MKVTDIRYGVLRMGAIVMLVIALITSIITLSAIRNDLKLLRDSHNQDAVWFASQMEFELLRLINTLWAYETGDPSVDKADVIRRFDILWSRQTSASPEMLSGALSDQPGLVEFSRVLRANEHLLDALDSTEFNAPRELRLAMTDLLVPLHETAVGILHRQTSVNSSTRSRLEKTSQFVVVVAVICGLASMFLVLLFWTDNRRNVRQLDEKRHLLEVAEAAYLEKSEFVGVVSHELRTPLTSIKGALGLIRQGVAGDVSEKLKSMVEIAYSNCERLSLMINDLLDLEKNEAGKLALNMDTVDVGKLVQDAIEANRMYGEKYGVVFRIKKLDPGLQLLGDENRLMQIFANLLSNAAKFSRSGTFVDISAERRGNNVRIVVRDHGIGIPDEFRHKVFEQFSQVDSSDSRTRGGTGLGMSIAKAIVEAHGGTIDFESEVGVGTTFHFELPALEAARSAA